MKGGSLRNRWPIIVGLFIQLLTIVESINVTESNGKHVPFLANLKASVKCSCKHPQPRLIHIGKKKKILKKKKNN